MNEPDVYVVSDNVLSPLGRTTAVNFEKLRQNFSGVRRHEDPLISADPFYASLFGRDEELIPGRENDYTRFEQLLIASIEGALSNSGIELSGKKTVLIISSTKGNISLLETHQNRDLKERIALSSSARLVKEHFGFACQPVIVSNACVSGVVAMMTGMRLLRTGQYENAVIAGADVISSFIFSGFESFQALSSAVCRPFDKSRDGLNLGEGAGTIVLSANKRYSQKIKVLGAGSSNDANHISGPSRTGQELSCAIKRSLDDAGLTAGDIGFISAHGTATPYNDEMEANAIALSGLQDVPLNSLKGYYGHTLGAAGLIESIISIESLRQGLILPTPGFKENGTSRPVNVITRAAPVKANYFLKTASGFGGCNAAIVFGK
jgi:3-oxoacyl-[acyl-carrier-protein] synthase I